MSESKKASNFLGTCSNAPCFVQLAHLLLERLIESV
jgi:hypothetical protein